MRKMASKMKGEKFERKAGSGSLGSRPSKQEREAVGWKWPYQAENGRSKHSLGRSWVESGKKMSSKIKGETFERKAGSGPLRSRPSKQEKEDVGGNWAIQGESRQCEQKLGRAGGESQKRAMRAKTGR